MKYTSIVYYRSGKTRIHEFKNEEDFMKLMEDISISWGYLIHKTSGIEITRFFPAH